MKSTTIILTLFAAVILIGSAVAAPPEPPAGETFVEFDKAPDPVDGFQSLFKNVNYPKSAKKDGVEGIVFVSVVIGIDGSVTDLEITESVRKDLDQAAMEAIKKTKSKKLILQLSNHHLNQRALIRRKLKFLKKIRQNLNHLRKLLLYRNL